VRPRKNTSFPPASRISWRIRAPADSEKALFTAQTPEKIGIIKKHQKKKVNPGVLLSPGAQKRI
jgi:hypothetical protein